MDDPAGTPVESGPIADVAPLGRYRPLQVASILLVIVGVAAVWLGLRTGLQLDGTSDLPRTAEAALALSAVALGAVAVVVGLVTNAARAMVVRERLPADRYRGPSVIVLLLIATVITIALIAPYALDLQRFLGGEPVSILAALFILTTTQLGLLAAAFVFVALPNALAGVRLLPPSHGARSMLIGLGLAIPAWIGTAILGYLLTRLLELMGRSAEAGVVDRALTTLDPTVLILAIVVVAPVAEEVFFRGVVFNAWLREYGEGRAFVGSAVLFASIHADTTSWDALLATGITVVPVIVVLGLMLAYVYRRTGSLLAAIALHAGFNGISLTIALLARLMGFELPS